MGGSSIAGYRVYRDYELLTPQQWFSSPYFDCGNLYAGTEYVYGVSAMDQLLIEGSMATAVLVTGAISAPVIPIIELEESTIESLNVSVILSCDNGGSMAISYEYEVQGANVNSSAYFSCCNFVINDLQSNTSYNVSVRVSNEFGSSSWTTESYTTRTGTPSEPSLSLMSANSYSIVLLIADPSPVDNEIEGYEIDVYLEGSLIWQDAVECTEAPSTTKWTCDRSIVIRNLSPSTSYNVFLRALGPLGSSQWINQNYETSNISTGKTKIQHFSIEKEFSTYPTLTPIVHFTLSGDFEFSLPNYSVESGYSTNLIVYRVGTSSGSSFVELNIIETGLMVLNCDCMVYNNCQCGIYMTSSGIQSQPANLTFLDGDISQSVAVSAWLDGESLLQSIDAVFTLSEQNTVLNYSKTTVLDISPSQQGGFASFIQSRTDVLENSTFVQVNVVRLNGTSGNISFNVVSFDITSVSLRDYVPIQQTIVLQDGQSVVSLWIKLIDDMYYRGTRIFGLRLTPSDNSVSLVTQRIVIFDDDNITNILPGAPTALRLTDRTGGELSFSWSPPTNDRILGFIVRVRMNTSDISGFFSIYNLTQPSIVLSNLPYESSYSIKVAAWNSFGLGVFGDSLTSSTTSPTRPTNPVDFEAAMLGSYSVQLVWNTSRDSGGLDIEQYVIWIQANGKDFKAVSRVIAPQTFANVNDLNSSTFYTFYIAAGTSMFPAVNTSMLTNVTVKTANETVPYKPKAVSLYSNQTGGTLSLQVEAYNDTELRHVSGFTVYLRSYNNIEIEVTGSFSAVCDEFSARISNVWGTCIVYKLLANTSYETYATFSNSVVSSKLFFCSRDCIYDLFLQSIVGRKSAKRAFYFYDEYCS